MQLSDHSHDLVLSSYLSVGRAFEMLSYVLSSLFGITLQPASCLPGETWHNEVRKVEVHHELHGKIGTVYCDLFQRRAEESGKMDHPAHFTVRCSRVLEDDDLVPNQGSPAMKNMSDFALLPDPVTGELRRYQLPIVVLVTGFKRPQSELNPSNLSFLELETVFHEMGHAVHSMLARTEFQHVSGTRVPMDFVEVASIFMEYFAKNPHVICRFAKHHGSGVPLSPTAFQSAVLEPKIQDIIDRQNQLQLSILDHKYHSTPEPVDTTQVLADIQNQYHVISYTKNTSWQVQFSHLFTYGAGYYTYAWSKRWASRLHTHLLKDKSPHEWREAGELINRELLAPGGSRSPWIGLQRIGIVKQGESKGRYSDPKLEDLGILSNRKD